MDKNIFVKSSLAIGLAIAITGCTSDSVTLGGDEPPGGGEPPVIGSIFLDLAESNLFGNAGLYGAGIEGHWHGKPTIVNFGVTSDIKETDGIGWGLSIPNAA